MGATARLLMANDFAEGGDMRKIALVGLSLAAVTAVTGVTAVNRAEAAPGWVERYVDIEVPHQPGPAEYDRVGVLQVGDPHARQVLVLVPGQFGSAGDFRLLARDLARRVPGTQVWAAQRREAALNDVTGFLGDPASAANYYLGGTYQSRPAAANPFVA